MLTINLEKELIKQNKKLITPAELLLVKEYDKHAPLEQDNTLKRLGLSDNLIEGKKVKDKKHVLQNETKTFNQQRVFHITQIQNLCEKYYLRFLPTYIYKGSIDDTLPLKISTFETAHKVNCTKNNTFIVAPKESFRLRTIPKDPLFFYKINEDYFYLIHKWGNDLSMFRRLKSFLSNGYIQAFISIIIAFVVGSYFFNITDKNTLSYPEIAWVNAIFSFMLSNGVFFVVTQFPGAKFFPEKNQWNSDINN